jgi:hypothetical protein
MCHPFHSIMIKASADMTAGLTVQVLKVFNTEAVG